MITHEEVIKLEQTARKATEAAEAARAEYQCQCSHPLDGITFGTVKKPATNCWGVLEFSCTACLMVMTRNVVVERLVEQ